MYTQKLLKLPTVLNATVFYLIAMLKGPVLTAGKLLEGTNVIRDAESIWSLENFKTRYVLSAAGLQNIVSRNTFFSNFPSLVITSWTISQTTLEEPRMPGTMHWAG